MSSSLSPSRGGDNFSGTKLRTKSQSPAASAAESKRSRIKSSSSQKTKTRHSASSVSYGTQNGYSCSCSIEVLQESPRAGTRRTLHYNGIASSYNSVEVDSLCSKSERHDGDGQTEESSQGATDSLCDPWEQSTSSTCTSTSSPRLRTSSCASQCVQTDTRGGPCQAAQATGLQQQFQPQFTGRGGRTCRASPAEVQL